jgi:hypothetical protein
MKSGDIAQKDLPEYPSISCRLWWCNVPTLLQPPHKYKLEDDFKTRVPRNSLEWPYNWRPQSKKVRMLSKYEIIALVLRTGCDGAMSQRSHEFPCQFPTADLC